MARPRKTAVTQDQVTLTEPGTVPAITPQFELTPQEMQAVLAARNQVGATENKIGISELAQALTLAMKAVQPPVKKTTFTRKKGDPWQNADGSPKPKMKRSLYHHSILLDPDRLDSTCIELSNKLKPGKYCEGYIQVSKRKDGAINIDYPVRTTAQRLRLVNAFGITSFTALLQRLVDEKTYPERYRRLDDDDDE